MGETSLSTTMYSGAILEWTQWSEIQATTTTTTTWLRHEYSVAKGASKAELVAVPIQ